MVYRALTGMQLPNGQRVEAGEWVAEDDLTKRAVSWLTKGGYLTREPDQAEHRSDQHDHEEEG